MRHARYQKRNSFTLGLTPTGKNYKELKYYQSGELQSTKQENTSTSHDVSSRESVIENNANKTGNSGTY